MPTDAPGRRPSRLLFGLALLASPAAGGCAAAPSAGVALPEPTSLSGTTDSQNDSDQDSPALTLSAVAVQTQPTSPEPAQAEPIDPPEPPASGAPDPAEPASPQEKTPAGLVERAPVDAMVGQINGRPLFASEFFDTMDARLRAEAQRRTPEEWLRFARNEVRKALRDRIRDELLLAEVESSLTPQQRAGVVTFVRSLRENLVSENRGSQEVANRRLLAEEGITLEKAVQARRDEELIRSWLRRILQNKVAISWRDIEQRYDRDYDRYHPPATATLRMIRVPADATGDIAIVNERLAAGDDFAALASLFSRWKPEEGGAYSRSLDAESYQASTIFGLDELNKAAQQLNVGQYVGPINVGSNVYWIRLDEVHRTSQSLYDVQLDIKNELFGERVTKAEGEYFEKLLERSGLSTTKQIDQMENRLFELAAERYLLSKQNGPVRHGQ